MFRFDQIIPGFMIFRVSPSKINIVKNEISDFAKVKVPMDSQDTIVWAPGETGFHFSVVWWESWFWWCP